MADPRIERQYQKLLKQREANVAKNLSEGRTINMSGVPLNEGTPETAGTLSDVISKIKEKGGATGNLENTVKRTGEEMIGISPEVKMKSRFPSIKKALGVADDLGTAAREETGGLLKNQSGFSKVLPALGIGAAALGALGIANKVQAGELGQAGLETADLATDYVPVISQLKLAARPSELGNAELPPEIMEQREIYNQARKAGQTGTSSQEQPLLEPEERARYGDMRGQFKNLINRMGD